MLEAKFGDFNCFDQICSPPLQVGDHVTVTGGQHSGQTGMVVHAENKVCTLISDATKQELNCFTKDLSERAEVQLGLDK